MAKRKVTRSLPVAQLKRRPRYFKIKVYEALHHLNRGFVITLNNLERLQALGMLRAGYLPTLRGLTGELQAEFNHHVLEILHAIEEKDWYRFGKISAARERLAFEKPLKKRLP